MSLKYEPTSEIATPGLSTGAWRYSRAPLDHYAAAGGGVMALPDTHYWPPVQTLNPEP